MFLQAIIVCHFWGDTTFKYQLIVKRKRQKIKEKTTWIMIGPICENFTEPNGPIETSQQYPLNSNHAQTTRVIEYFSTTRVRQNLHHFIWFLYIIPFNSLHYFYKLK